MFGLNSLALRKKLILIFIIISVVPILIVAYFSVNQARKTLIKEEFAKLNAIRMMKSNRLEAFFLELIKGIQTLSNSRDLHILTDELMAKHQTEIHNAVGPEIKYDPNIRKEAQKYINSYMKTYSRPDIIIFCNKGHFIYSSEHPEYFNKSVLDKPESNLATCFKNTIESKKITITDFAKDPYYNNRNTMYISMPLFDNTGKIEAVVAMQVVPKTINSIVDAKTSEGATYLVGEDFLMRSTLESSDNDTVLEEEVRTIASKAALNDKSGNMIIKNYLGQDVFSSYSPFHFDNIPGIYSNVKNWAVISELPEAIGLKPVYRLIYTISVIVVIVLLIVIVLGTYFSGTIVKPIITLANKAMYIAKENDLTVELPKRKNKDEITSLISSFNNMLETLKAQILDISAGSTQLAASITEISTTATELAASTAESSTSVSEISTTVEEIRQISQGTYEKSVNISETAKNSSNVADEGLVATNTTIKGINNISEEMNYIAQSTLKLGEQTQSVSEIINTVNNLADQTNLLSVNASIEAAKAGEYGKGFSVVAKEVKALADQSREATKQISGILTDIQKATSAAVLATERGNKAVQSGLELSQLAGKAIKSLNENIKEAADATEQISISSQQELGGMDELVTTMNNIKDALIQNSDGTKQLEESATSLNQLSEKLSSMANSFKVAGNK